MRGEGASRKGRPQRSNGQNGKHQHSVLARPSFGNNKNSCNSITNKKEFLWRLAVLNLAAKIQCREILKQKIHVHWGVRTSGQHPGHLRLLFVFFIKDGKKINNISRKYFVPFIEIRFCLQNLSFESTHPGTAPASICNAFNC